MNISPDLQAKIDALEDEVLKDRIIRTLSMPGKSLVSDEAIFENAVAAYAMAKEQQARLRKWQADEVEDFARYFEREFPGPYKEFVRQELEFNRIESDLAWDVRRIMSRWIPGLDYDDRSSLFLGLREYVGARSV